MLIWLLVVSKSNYVIVIVSPFLRYTYAFFPLRDMPYCPVRALRRTFPRILTIRTMRGRTLYISKIAFVISRLVALAATSNVYTPTLMLDEAFSVMRGARRISVRCPRMVPRGAAFERETSLASAAFFPAERMTPAAGAGSVFLFRSNSAIKDSV